MAGPFWRKNKDASFAVLLSVVESYYHPETPPDGGAKLHRLVHRVGHEHVSSQVHDIPKFLDQLRAAIADPSQIPGDALDDAADFEDGSDEAFLARVWHDIYPGRPLPTADSGNGDSRAGPG
ncbi:hypothetical protein [Allonocardiopsis opalescens]|uniref:CdiI immunity protein domain-containing protein n=1 Tax=Allonocardiopsis opalescens TaxID=1144618 RepID=A0A2T0Q9R5_9ACTN|nr:hypothetical protein [Allonocardiopsis opalescens]PRY00636.1 hypothetical protein CLV72_102267 [Allonocardiopsis opalescens]